MQARKELTLSVLEDVSRRKFDAVPNTPARGAEGTAADLRRLRRAPGRGSLCLCSQFEARLLWSSGLVVAVFVCVNVYGGVCSFVCLFADSCLPLFPWLVGCLCRGVLECVFCTLRHIFVLY